MSKQVVTIDLVRLARQQLREKGERLSDNNIKKFLGFGSPNSINRFNRELREAELREELAKEMDFPAEVRTAFVAATTKRVVQDTAAITEKWKEAELCQKEAVEREEAGQVRIAELEKLLAEAQEEKQTMSTTLVKREKDHEVALEGLKTALSGQAEVLKGVTEERDHLLEANRNMTEKATRQEEAERLQKEELDRLRKEKDTLEKDLSKEQKNAAVAERECKLLNKSIEEKNAQIRAQEDELKELRKIAYSRHGDSRKNGAPAGKAPAGPKKGKGGPPAQESRPLS